VDKGGLKIYSSSPNRPIPDGTGDPGASDVITVPDSGTFTGMCLGLAITHTFVGDLCVTLSNLTNGTSVNLINRPGAGPASDCMGNSGSGFGCSQDNYNNILLCDGGPPIEPQCVPNLSSPPAYGPNNAFAAFSGKDKFGDWEISVSDNATLDVGALNSWSLHFTNAPGQVDITKPDIKCCTCP
jgi:subtilisin-like proprotein convertase family protein